MKPVSLRIRMYQVGFGDCFLLSFVYAGDQPKRHVLVDFGSTGAPKGLPPRLMLRIAKDIVGEVGDEPFAVVATHRHKDHISGFDPGASGKGPGALIRSLKPKLVLQPWTEAPDLARDATGPIPAAAKTKTALQHREALRGLHAIASRVTFETVPRLKRSAASRAVARELEFIGQDNLSNAAAVRNLMTMAPNDYLHAGRKTRLEKFLPGVKVDVLGPPTVRQHAGVRRQVQDSSQYWIRQAFSSRVLEKGPSSAGGSNGLKGSHVRGSKAPPWARWSVRALRRENVDQTLSMVRELDNAMNNTSLVLLFRSGNQSLLFPGDAQWENWEYALAQKAVRSKLKSVSLVKVGHHGSRNATPLELWDLWFPQTPSGQGRHKAAGGKRMVSMLSTMPGKHGSEDKDTEVPRIPLLNALKSRTTLLTTEGSRALSIDTVVEFAAQTPRE